MAKNKKSEDNCIKVLNEIDKIKRELETARINFDMVSDNELTDYYIYEMAALNSKYNSPVSSLSDTISKFILAVFKLTFYFIDFLSVTFIQLSSDFLFLAILSPPKLYLL